MAFGASPITESAGGLGYGKRFYVSDSRLALFHFGAALALRLKWSASPTQ